MKDQFPFLGIKSPERRSLQRQALDRVGPPPGAPDLSDAAAQLWTFDEREFQYAACDLLAKHVRLLSAGGIDLAHRLIVTKPWWDTVDSLAAHCVGPLVARFPRLAVVVDTWAEGGGTWERRTALLHQLRYGGRTDEERLFRYCLLLAQEREFFIRKAIGWALRQYSRVAPAAVVDFVATNREVLSPLSQREALEWLETRKTGQAAAAAAGVVLPAG